MRYNLLGKIINIFDRSSKPYTCTYYGRTFIPTKGDKKMYTKAKGEIARVAQIFQKKKALESFLAIEILKFEDESGLRIDSIHYERDITLPTRGSLYTDLSIVITTDLLSARDI